MSESLQRVVLVAKVLFLFAALFVPFFSISLDTTTSLSVEVTGTLHAQQNIRPEDRFSGLCEFDKPTTWFTICLPNPIYKASSYLLVWSGALFDYMLNFTLNTCILASEGITNIWSDLKDVANLGFIIGLIAISLSLITGRSTGEAKKNLMKLVIIALVLNFSLFVSKVIIDAGNISALTFYNSITSSATPYANGSILEVQGSVADATNCSTNQDVKSISGALVGLFNPSRIFNADTFTDADTTQITEQSTIFMGILIVGILMNVMMAKELFLAGFMFISRTMGLILLMVISPLAFVSHFLPGPDMLSTWFKKMIDKAFCVVVYLFFLWLIIMITQNLFEVTFANSVPGQQQEWRTALILVIIQFAIIYGLVKQANSTVTKMCDQGGFGKALQGAAVKGLGLAGGLATGGTGAVARRFAGRIGYNALEGQNRLGRSLADMAQSKSGTKRFIGNLGLGASEWAANAKFGTANGYKKAADADADAQVKKANRLGNVVERVEKNRAEQDFARNLRSAEPTLTDEQIKQRTNTYLKEQSRTFKTSGNKAGQEYLKGRTDGVTGVMASVMAGLVPDGPKEAVSRFSAKEKEAKSKLEKQTELATFANGIAAALAQQSTEIASAVQAGIARATETIKSGGTAQDVVATTEAKEVTEQVNQAIQPTDVKDGKVVAVDDTKITTQVKADVDTKFNKDIEKAVETQKRADQKKKDRGIWKVYKERMEEDMGNRGKILELLAEMAEKSGEYGLAKENATIRSLQERVESNENQAVVLKDIDTQLPKMSEKIDNKIAQQVRTLERNAELQVKEAFKAVETVAKKSLDGKSNMRRQMAEAQYRSVSDESAKVQETTSTGLATTRDRFAEDTETGTSGN